MSSGRVPTANRTSSNESIGEYGQGWTQMTEHGKIYLSKKERNVFIIEGTTSAGFSGSAFTGTVEQQGCVNAGAFTLTTELKCVPGDQCTDQQVYVVLDCNNISELSSGCDFCGVRLAFDSRELRVESHRRNASKQTLFVQPNCALLRPATYATLTINLADDAVSVSLSGVSLISNLPMARQGSKDVTGPPRIGIAVYGRTRCYLRRFRIEALGDAGAATPAATLARGGKSPLRTTGRQSSLALVSQQIVPQTPTGGALPPANVIGQASGVGMMGEHSRNSQATEEMELTSLIERDIVVADLRVRFEDIGGLEEAKRALNEAVVLPLILPDLFTGIRRPWKGVLLFGPPGTGKTMLAKAVASSVENVTFFNCSSATLTSKWRGESEKLLRALFNTARSRVPSVLFFDEIDSLLAQRGSAAEHEASRRFKSEFLIHLDGLLSDSLDVHPSGHLLILATSNAPWDLDEALRRRLEKRIHVPLPDQVARQSMFRHYLRDVRTAAGLDIERLAVATENYSGADIQLICREASMNPMRRAVNGLTPTQMVQMRDEGLLTADSLAVEMSDFQAALVSIQPSVALADCRRYHQWADEFGSK